LRGVEIATRIADGFPLTNFFLLRELGASLMEWTDRLRDAASRFGQVAEITALGLSRRPVSAHEGLLRFFYPLEPPRRCIPNFWTASAGGFGVSFRTDQRE